MNSDPKTYNGDVVSPDDSWQQLDTIVRGWAIMSQFRKDLEAYDILKKQYSYE
jgi:hypothetical protein